MTPKLIRCKANKNKLIKQISSLILPKRYSVSDFYVGLTNIVSFYYAEQYLYSLPPI